MDLINCPLSSFAVCADPNAAKAKQQHQEKLFNWYNVVAQDHNKFASYTKAMDTAAIGLSRAYSDNNEKYLNFAGAVRATSANNLRKYLSSKDSGLSSQEGRSRNAGKKALTEYLSQQGKLDAQLAQLGTNMFKADRAALLQNLKYKAEARNELGQAPVKGLPTLIPRRNPLTQFAKAGLLIGGAALTAGSSLATSGTWLAKSGAAWGAGLSTAGSLIPNY